ncbi:unnamed protein product (macronuclear) [Paramecium tetraurelia]|uniref:Myb-like DNA-binding domain containing protein n=1 Tax=Paramecium tetraurelia TaxID=5888 RepID=A0E713_PARTE|nr:uncharacterized protein GSPATT00023808001 [Paramecium tetraurelia]CAK91080.1 unnamed protein product [Paramecium tetraurelia]|eukprot:XP_001458477.1 hypothetical protein (macronuclear) [Paramecium tetraurelia strain d4-2]
MVKHCPSEDKKKRKPWTPQEDKLLKKFVKKYEKERLAWKKISSALKSHGFYRDTKACRERFSNHLDRRYNKANLTDKEIDQLFELIELYGNKWTFIAEQLNNRTDQDIKNKFYAHVKKIIRRLIKVAYQTTESSVIIAKIQPLLISSIYCHDDEDNDKILKIDDKMKVLFKQLIRNNKKIKVGDKVDDQTIDQVKNIMKYLVEQNDKYLEKKVNKQAQKVQIKKLKYKKTFKVQLGLDQQNIIKKIQEKKPIFTTKNIKIEKYLFNIPPPLMEQTPMPEFKCPIENVYSYQPMLISNPYWDTMFSNSLLFRIQYNQNTYGMLSDKY